MAVGPVQLIVLGFDHPNFQGEVLAELEKLRDSDTIRVIDALAVSKDAEGDVTILKAIFLKAFPDGAAPQREESRTAQSAPVRGAAVTATRVAR